MKTLQDFANESLENCEDDFDLIFDEFVSELDNDDDKTTANNLKESWKRKFASHARNAASSAKSFLHSMWHDDHVGR